MSLITRVRKQKALWFAKSKFPNNEGDFDFHEPVEIACRWDDAITEIIQRDGSKVTSKAMVMVDRPMKAGDILVLGTIDQPLTKKPTGNEGGSPIIQFTATPNLRNTETLYVAYL